MSLKTAMTLPRLTLCTALVLSALSTLNAQSVATAPVGGLTYSFKQGTQLVGLSLLKPAVASGKVSAVSSLSLSVEGGTNVGAALTSSRAYYVEIVKDDVNGSLYTGDRYEVDTSATIAAPAGTVVLKSSPENTIAGNPPTALIGVNFTIRPHLTLGGLLSDLPNAFIAGDKITIRENGGTSITATLNSSGTTWNAGLTNKNSLIVYPGVGFFLVRASASTTTAVLTGDVRTNSFVQIFKTGNQVIAEGFPVDSAPAPTTAGAASRDLINTFGTSFVSGDKLTAYNPSGALITYTYSTSTNRWSAGLTNGNTLNLFHPTTASFLTATNADDSYVQPVPFSL